MNQPKPGAPEVQRWLMAPCQAHLLPEGPLTLSSRARHCLNLRSEDRVSWDHSVSSRLVVNILAVCVAGVYRCTVEGLRTLP